MKAITFHQPGGPEVLRYEDAPAPAPGPGQVLVRVKACGLNHLDLIVRKRGPVLGLPWAHITGSDAAGAVEALGTGVAGIELGMSEARAAEMFLESASRFGKAVLAV